MDNDYSNRSALNLKAELLCKDEKSIVLYASKIRFSLVYPNPIVYLNV
jgi:hypothetical protein